MVLIERTCFINRQRTESQEDVAMQQDAPSGSSGGPRKRPRIDMATEPRERKRGKTMFGLVLGTLKRAKTEDKERNASDAVCASTPVITSTNPTDHILVVLVVLCWSDDCGGTDYRRGRGKRSNRGYRISYEKRLILSGELKRLKRTRRWPIERKKSYNSRIRSCVTLLYHSPFAF